MYKLQVSPLRLNYTYILWYKNIATFVCTMVLPLALLAYWNTKTYRVMMNRPRIFRRGDTALEKETLCLKVLKKFKLKNEKKKEGSEENSEDKKDGTSLITTSKDESASNVTDNRCTVGKTSSGSNGTSELELQHTTNLAVSSHDSLQQSCHPMSTIKREEDGKARILFVVIFIFLACNTPRFVLNFEECLAGRDYTAAAKAGCNLHPFWALVLNHVSQLLICVNSSLGFVIYCVMSRDFRSVLSEKVNKYL